MPANVDIQWKGVEQLTSNLKMLSLETKDKLAMRAVGKAAKNVRDAAKDNVIHLWLIETGALLDNIAFARKKPNGLVYSYDIGVRHGTKKQIREDNDPWYWWMLEFGTVKRPGTPFMVPAFEQQKEKSLELMRDTLATGIENALKAAKK